MNIDEWNWVGHGHPMMNMYLTASDGCFLFLHNIPTVPQSVTKFTPKITLLIVDQNAETIHCLNSDHNCSEVNSNFIRNQHKVPLVNKQLH